MNDPTQNDISNESSKSGTPKQKLTHTKDGFPLPQQCPMHRMWIRKGQCEMCRLEEDKRRKQMEGLTGANKQQPKIGRL